MPKRGKAKKEKPAVEPVEKVKASKGKVSWAEPQDPKSFGSQEKAAKAPETDDDDVLSDAEAGAMIDRVEEKKQAEVRKVEQSVELQEWNRQDPEIPESLAGKVWIAVYKCPEGHKTKATNKQAGRGVPCFECKGLGKTVTAQVMPQFINRPSTERQEQVEENDDE